MINDFVKIGKTFLCFMLLMLAIKALVLPRFAKDGERKEENFRESFPVSNAVAQVQVCEKWSQKQVSVEKADMDGRNVKDAKPSAEKLAVGIKRLQQNAERGDAEAQYMLSISFEQGYGNMKSLEKALEWLQKAANGGYERAQCALGMRYLMGNGLQKDYTQARIWLEKVIDAKDPKVKEAAKSGIERINLIEIMGGEESMERTRRYLEAEEAREKSEKANRYRRNFLETVGGEEKLQALEESLL